MTKRIPLTEDDFELEFRPDDEEFNENYQKYCIIIKDNDDKSAEVIQQQILDDQEKAEKLPRVEDSLLGRKQLIKTLEQKIKQLKEVISVGESKYNYILNENTKIPELEVKIAELENYNNQLKELSNAWESKANKLNPLIEENKKLKEYKAEIERLAKDDSLWNNIVELDNLKQKLEKIKHLAEIRYDTEIFEILDGDSTS